MHGDIIQELPVYELSTKHHQGNGKHNQHHQKDWHHLPKGENIFFGIMYVMKLAKPRVEKLSFQSSFPDANGSLFE